MCNLYEVGPAPGRARFDWELRLRELLGQLSLGYVAPGKPGLVARRGENGGWEGAVMRWGFARPWSPAITNARDDKLTSQTWAEAWERRRCVLPVRQFFEWSGAKGKKTKHAIRADPGGDAWFWIGGLWEEGAAEGACYTMLTTAANAAMADIHGRMPLILGPGDVEEFVRAAKPPLHLVRPYGGPLEIEPPPPASPPPREETAELF